ncbi:hypothetical protein EPIR_1519 [Erwinia piriflorinigrans CFBP 5888]|uniref:Uncharacterized protein n=1 Tax=Erwinia piriflorinigrans CFBP 5888 TaxID=1161919 RepID=V5Z7E4_9GAMM|nr:hypothetical protein EPIR_1519 [Erwinia piriflorinigrans CFBP 5888]
MALKSNPIALFSQLKHQNVIKLLKKQWAFFGLLLAACRFVLITGERRVLSAG